MGAFSELDLMQKFGCQGAGDTLPGFDDDANENPAASTTAQTHEVPPATPAEPAAPAVAAPETTAGTDEPANQTEDEKRKAHEEAEAKRKAEFDAKQAAKKAAQAEQLAKVQSMTDGEVTAAAMQRVGADTEKLTRRSMKECVAEHIQTKCIEDPAFARLTMYPAKSMIHCFWYINRHAREYLQEEMKNNDTKPEGPNGVYGGDVPDDLCYQWAEDYFRDMDAEEDHRDDEEFVPKPYYGKSTTSKPKKAKEPKKKDAPKPKPKPAEEENMQFTLLGAAS